MLTTIVLKYKGAYSDELVVPKSDATNVYDLLMDVATAIEQEPRRYNQEQWLLRVEPGADETGRAKYPACGTIACRAGWIVQLAREQSWYPGAINMQARDILGLELDHIGDKDRDTEWWFYDDIVVLFNGDALAGKGLTIGTPEYAKAGAEGVRQFAEKWKERLTTTPVNKEATDER